MTVVLVLLLVNAVLGAADTLWYHEYRARLTAHLDVTRTELRLHVARDAVYVGLYGYLAWWRPSGWLAGLVLALLAVEVAVTMADFVVEDRDRPQLGGLAPGERVLHSLMAIVYGAMLASLLPTLVGDIAAETASTTHGAPTWLSLAATAAAAGIAVSGARDALALAGTDPIWTPKPKSSVSDTKLLGRRERGTSDQSAPRAQPQSGQRSAATKLRLREKEAAIAEGRAGSPVRLCRSGGGRLGRSRRAARGAQRRSCDCERN